MPQPGLAVLLQEIRSDAVHESMDLSTVLRKCKVFARETGNHQMEDWSTWESVGYPTMQSVPHYRLWNLRLTGEFKGPFGKTKTAPVPQHFLPQYARNFRDAYECRESIALIEDSLQRAKDGFVSVNTGDLHLSVGRKLYRGYKCVSVTAEVHAGQLTDTLNAVRDHIVDVTSTLLQQQDWDPNANFQHSGRDWVEAAPSAPGLVVRRNPSQEERELEQAWSRVRYTSRPR